MGEQGTPASSTWRIFTTIEINIIAMREGMGMHISVQALGPLVSVYTYITEVGVKPALHKILGISGQRTTTSFGGLEGLLELGGAGWWSPSALSLNV